MNEIGAERIGTALRKLAQDLVTERNRVARLERENRELRAELERLRNAAALAKIRATSPRRDDAPDRVLDERSSLDDQARKALTSCIGAGRIAGPGDRGERRGRD